MTNGKKAPKTNRMCSSDGKKKLGHAGGKLEKKLLHANRRISRCPRNANEMFA